MKIKIKKSVAGILTTAFGFSFNLIKDKKMRKYTIAVAGVLAVMFGATVMADQYNQSILNTQRVGLSLFFLDGIQAPEDQLPSLLETDEIMPVAQGCCFEGLDTETGSIEVIDCYYDYPLPLCFNDCEVADWELIVEVTGGYEPLCGIVEIYQPKTGKGGYIQIDWERTGYIPCNTYIWEASFSVCTDFSIDSNHIPVIECCDPCDPCGNCWICGPDDLDKLVNLGICTLWTGCDQPEQEFTIIPV